MITGMAARDIMAGLRRLLPRLRMRNSMRNVSTSGASRKRRARIIRRAFWDRKVEPSEIEEILTERRPPSGWLSAERIVIRLIESVTWYDVLDVLGLERARDLLSPTLIGKVRSKELRHRYEFTRRVLQGEALSVAGWDP